MNPPKAAIPAPGTRAAIALVLDVVIVGVFTLVGRRTHEEPLDPAGWWHTAWPFLVGLLVAWALVVLARRLWPTGPVDGIPVWIITVMTAMVLRALTDQGTALSFVIVATLFLGATLLGWRALVAWWRSQA